ncbi:MAG: PD40 domain-containing protein [Bacteroidetes bacterium]|nr:PD40 domain-containing protein [Bacteroidota bacterium]
MSLFIGVSAFAQKVNSLRLLKNANAKLDAADYVNALAIYKQLYSIDSTDKEYNYKIGVCLFEIKSMRTQAHSYFQKAIGYDAEDVYYYLGQTYHMKAQYDKALESYYRYQNSSSGKEHSFYEVNNLIAKSLYAKYAEAHPLTDILIENAGGKINTSEPEYAPLIPADESYLVFTSKRASNKGGNKSMLGDFYEDVFVSRREGNEWAIPTNTLENINTEGNDACTGVSADGQKMIIYRSSDTLMSGEFYTSTFDGVSWRKSELLDVAINSKDYVETSACYAPDGECIYFSSDMPGGFGGKDLYVIKKLLNGKWGKPFNLGKNINTPYDEDAPFIHPKENLLFFSSQGHLSNMGGYDVFKSYFEKDSSSFGKPENIGYPINTCGDDIFFVLNTNGNAGYFSSEREGGFGQSDIYKVSFISDAEKYVVIACKLESQSGLGIQGGKIKLIDISSGKMVGAYTSNAYTGSFILIVEPGKKYEVLLQDLDNTISSEKYTYNKGDATTKKFVLKK